VPTWSELLAQLSSGQWVDANGNPDYDSLRKHYITALSAKTGRNTVVYATDYLNPFKGGNPDLSIILADIQGLMEVYKDLPVDKGLDLILHSPGGDPTAADSLVRYTRARFTNVRVIVPIAAMSAATMWSLSADEIVMGAHSQLGPVDPQMNLGRGFVPAGAIKRNFERAQRECADDPRLLSGWVPTLQQYFPGLLEMCDDYTRLSKELVEEYLVSYMFRRRKNKAALASAAAEFFAKDDVHIAHSRGIGRDKLRAIKLRVTNLEDDPALQDLVLSVHHSFNHTFNGTGVVKIIENNLGRAWVKFMPMIPGPVAPPGP
jgi:hypothetical protein